MTSQIQQKSKVTKNLRVYLLRPLPIFVRAAMASRSAFSKLSRLSIFNSNNLTLPTQCRALTVTTNKDLRPSVLFLQPYSSPVLKSSHHQPLLSTTSRHFSLSSTNHKDKKPEEKKEENLSLGKKFKKMFKDYSYVLVPVHVATSVVWYGQSDQI